MNRTLHDSPQPGMRPLASTPVNPSVLKRQRTPAPGSTMYSPIVLKALSAPGQPLAAPVRAVMESRFAHDFSQVRIHTGGEAAASTRTVGALAYTVNSDVVFGESQFAPATTAGRRLLAHELAHVVQQGTGGAGSPSPLELDESQSSAEGEAVRHSESALAGQAPPAAARLPSVSRRIQRQKSPDGPAEPDPEAAGWTLEDSSINFAISNPARLEASSVMITGSATGPGFSGWSNKNIFSISPPEAIWLHTNYWVDTAEHPLPRSQDKLSVFNDIKFTTSSGQTPVDAHFLDNQPLYDGPGRPLRPKLGLTTPSDRGLPVQELPLAEGGELVWRAGFGFGKGAKAFTVGGTFRVPAQGPAPAPQGSPGPASGGPAAAAPGAEKKGTPLPASPKTQPPPAKALGEIKELTDLIKITQDAATRDLLVSKLRDALAKLQPFIPEKDASQAINEAINSLIKDGTSDAIMSILKAIAGKGPTTMPEDRNQTGPNVPQKDLDEHVFKGPKITIKDAPALPPRYSFQYRKGPQNSYPPGAVIKFTIVPPEDFNNLQGFKRVVIVAEADRNTPNRTVAGPGSKFDLESNATREIELRAPTEPGKYVIRVDIGLNFDLSNMQEFEVTAPQQK